MRSLFADVCWPRRYVARLLTVFGAAVVFGGLLTLVRVAFQGEMQGMVTARVYYEDLPQGETVGAWVYKDARTLAHADPKNLFYVPAGGAIRAMHTGFGRPNVVIQLVRDKPYPQVTDVFEAIGPPRHQRLHWAQRKREPVRIEIERDYRKADEDYRLFRPSRPQ